MRRRFGVLPVCITGCAIALGAARAEVPSPAFPLADIEKGQRGYGLSVFEGTEPERFEAEIIGVLRNVSPDTSFILARLSGQGLENTGVIAGMSGSPVYIDGKVAGAVAAAWPFAKEAIALVMPIESMRTLRGQSAAAVAKPVSADESSERLRQLLSGQLPDDTLAKALATLVPRLPAGASSGLEWSAAGFGERSLGLLRTAVGAVSPAGQASAGGAATAAALVPGAAVAGILIDGDLRMAVTGTVSDRSGNEVLAFGHPFLDAGPVLLPMAPAEIITVLASQYSSFKLSSFGEPVGAFDEDRSVGVHGRIGVVAPTVPMSVKVGERRFQMRLAAVPQLLPALMAISAMGSLDSAGHVVGPQGYDLDLRLQTRGHGELRLRQSFDGEQAAAQSATYLAAVAGFLAENPLAEVELNDISVDFAPSEKPRTAAITGAHADRTLVRPGEEITVNVDFLAYRGLPFRRTLALTIPADVPNGRYSLFVGDGAHDRRCAFRSRACGAAHLRPGDGPVALAALAPRAGGARRFPGARPRRRRSGDAPPAGLGAFPVVRRGIGQCRALARRDRATGGGAAGDARRRRSAHRSDGAAPRAAGAGGTDPAHRERRDTACGLGLAGQEGRRTVSRFVRLGLAALALASSVGYSSPAWCAPVKIFRAQTAQQFLTGTFEGVSLDPLGALRLADRADRVAALGEPFLLAAAAHPGGWVLGTGNAGRVLLVDREGKTSVLFEAPEPEVFAVWADSDGTVFAGTSPEGKVYRIAGGKGEVWFSPGETYIWGIERSSDGSLLVATGTQGRLYRVTGRDQGKVLYDSDDTHIRALRALPGGDLLLGTAGEGLLLRLDAAGRARTLYDAEEPEIVGFAVAPDGTATPPRCARRRAWSGRRKPSAARASRRRAKRARGTRRRTMRTSRSRSPPRARARWRRRRGRNAARCCASDRAALPRACGPSTPRPSTA